MEGLLGEVNDVVIRVREGARVQFVNCFLKFSKLSMVAAMKSIISWLVLRFEGPLTEGVGAPPMGALTFFGCRCSRPGCVSSGSLSPRKFRLPLGGRSFLLPLLESELLLLLGTREVLLLWRDLMSMSL